MTINEAIYNIKQAQCVPYKHETLTFIIQRLKGKNGMIQNKLDLATETIEQIKRICGEAFDYTEDKESLVAYLESINQIIRFYDRITPMIERREEEDGTEM